MENLVGNYAFLVGIYVFLFLFSGECRGGGGMIFEDQWRRGTKGILYGRNKSPIQNIFYVNCLVPNVSIKCNFWELYTMFENLKRALIVCQIS